MIVKVVTVKEQDKKRQADAASLASQKSIRKYDALTLLFLSFITSYLKSFFIKIFYTLNRKYAIKSDKF